MLQQLVNTKHQVSFVFLCCWRTQTDMSTGSVMPAMSSRRFSFWLKGWTVLFTWTLWMNSLTHPKWRPEAESTLFTMYIFVSVGVFFCFSLLKVTSPTVILICSIVLRSRTTGDPVFITLFCYRVMMEHLLFDVPAGTCRSNTVTFCLSVLD